MLVIDLAKEREAGFPLVDLSDRKAGSQAAREQRYIYFTLLDGDDTQIVPHKLRI